MRFQAGLTIIEWRLLQLLEFVDWHKGRGSCSASNAFCKRLFANTVFP